MKNIKGFSLIEVMIAAAGLAGLSLVLMNLTKQTTKSSIRYKFDSEVNLIANEIVGILSSPSKCLSVFGAKNAINTTTGISHINNQYYVLADPLAPLGGYGDASIKLSNYELKSTMPDIALNISNLYIYFKRSNLLGPGDSVKKIKLYVEVDGGNLITACHSIASHSVDIWSRGTGTTIFYPGKVGIGNPAPAYELDVVGAINSSSTISGASFATTGNVSATGNITATGVSYASSFQYTSDQRLKKDIHTINDSSNIIFQLRPVKFRWKKNDKSDYGFIAQEVKKVIPEITSVDEQKIMRVDYAKIIPFLVDQVQKQQEEINRLKKRIDE